MEDDFVVDDGVGGYMDNGVDDWEAPEAEAESETEAYEVRKKGEFLFTA